MLLVIDVTLLEPNATRKPLEPEMASFCTGPYAALLWELFRALIDGALNDLVRDLGRKVVRRVLLAIDQTVEEFLNDAFHLNPDQMAVQMKAEELGFL